MISEIKAKCLDYKDIDCVLSFESATSCPRCGKGIQPVEVSAAVYTKNKETNEIS